ncbi:hypothetical protein N7465_003175 [Penicillium sp. CMV-2018d]|nr:hypothetical protein N7465_003175 [Penicillium sp. CMV-2018d]
MGGQGKDNLLILADGHKPKSICLLRILSQLLIGSLDPFILTGAAERGEQGPRNFIPQPTLCQRTLKADYRDEVPYRETSQKLGVPILIHAFRPNNEFSRTDHPIILGRSMMSAVLCTTACFAPL